MLKRHCAIWLLLLAGQAVALPPLKVALLDVAPYVISQPGRAASGPYVLLVQTLAREAGLEPLITLLPFARIPASLANGSADLTIGFATEAVERVALTLGPVSTVDSLVVIRISKPATSVAQLGGYRIGRARGGCQDLADRMGPAPAPQLIDVNSYDSGIRMLALGRLDGLCLTSEVLVHYARKAGIERSQLGTEIIIGEREVAVFVRRDLDAGMVARLRSAVARLTPARPGPAR